MVCLVPMNVEFRLITILPVITCFQAIQKEIRMLATKNVSHGKKTNVEITIQAQTRRSTQQGQAHN
jgi:hypothetical protein